MIEVKLNLVDHDNGTVLEKFVTLSTEFTNAQEKETMLKDMLKEFSEWAESYIF